MKDMTTLPFITMTSSLWLHLRTCLIKMKCCILRKKSDVSLLLLTRDSSKALLRHKGLGYHRGVEAPCTNNELDTECLLLFSISESDF